MSKTKAEVKSKEQPQSKPRRSKGDGSLFKNSKGGHIPGVGAAALTGVGLFTPILMLINACAMLAGSGGAPRAAISMGKKDNKTAEKILGNCFVILLLMAVALTVLFFAFAPQLLTLFGASDQTLPYGVDYARIYILGSIFVLIVMGMNPFITTQGFAKITLIFGGISLRF